MVLGNPCCDSCEESVWLALLVVVGNRDLYWADCDVGARSLLVFFESQCCFPVPMGSVDKPVGRRGMFNDVALSHMAQAGSPRVRNDAGIRSRGLTFVWF